MTAYRGAQRAGRRASTVHRRALTPPVTTNAEPKPQHTGFFCTRARGPDRAPRCVAARRHRARGRYLRPSYRKRCESTGGVALGPGRSRRVATAVWGGGGGEGGEGGGRGSRERGRG